MVVRRSALVGLVVLGLLGIPAPASAAPGDVNTDFGTNGTVFDGVGGSFGIDTRLSGKLVTARNGAGNVIVSKRFPRGALDPSFGTDGRVALQFGGFVTFGGEVAHDSLENILVGVTLVNMGTAGMAVARLTPDGALDTTFSTDGWIGNGVPGFTTMLRDVLPTTSGAVVMLGQRNVAANSVAVRLVKAGSNGTFDPAFGTGGISEPFTFNNTHVDIDSIVESGAGYIVGLTLGDSAYLMRITGDGHLDTAFGDAGFTQLRFGTNVVSLVEIARRPNGRIMAALNLSGASDRLAVAVVRPNGILDSTFSGDGRQVLPLNSPEQYLRDMAISSTGTAYVTGVRQIQIRGHWRMRGFVAAVLSTGALDAAFSGDGVAGFDMGPENDLYVSAIALGAVSGSPLFINGMEYNADLALNRARIVSFETA